MTIATCTLTRLGSQDDADKLVTTLRAAMEGSYLQPEIGAAPAGGEFEVFVTTGYEFMVEDGTAPAADQDKALMDHMLAVLAYALLR